MASLVFSVTGGRTRAFAFESGDVISDFGNLGRWEVTDDTDRLRTALGKMTISKIETTIRSLNFTLRTRGSDGGRKFALIQCFLENWERIMAGALATHAQNQAMAYLRNQAEASAPVPASEVATGSDGAPIAPFSGSAHRLTEEVKDDPSTALLGDTEVDSLITQARDMGWNINVIKRGKTPAVPEADAEKSDTEKSNDVKGITDADHDLTLADFYDMDINQDDYPKFYQSFLEDGADFVTKTVSVIDNQRRFQLVELKVLASTTVADLKGKICQCLIEKYGLVAQATKVMTTDDFRLLNVVRRLFDDDVLTDLPDDMGHSDYMTMYLELVLRGGGKTLPTKKSVITKKTIIETKKKDLLGKVSGIDVAKIQLNMEKKIIQDATESMSKLYNCAENEGMVAFKYLLQKLSVQNLGDKKKSPAIDALKASHMDTRLSKLEDLMLRDAYPALYTLYDEVSGLLETAELTFEYVLNSTFLKEGGGMDWAKIRRAIEDEQTRRAPPAEIAGDDMDL